MIPAGQRLEAGDHSVAQVDKGLECQPKLIPLDRATQFRLEAESLARGRAVARLVDFGMARNLGALHRELGIADQIFGIVGLGRYHRHAHRAVDLDLEFSEPDRCREARLHTAGRAHRLRAVVGDAEQHREFVAREAREHVAGAQGRYEPAGDGDDQLVAGQRTDAFIDPAEAGQIDQQDRELAAFGRKDIPRILDLLGKGGAVRQAGEAIAQHLRPERTLTLDLLGTIAALAGFSIFRFLLYVREELLTVLGTSSSEAGLVPLMDKLERLGCSKSVVGLVVPAGYSFNLDGTNIYLTMAAIFVAQALDIELTWMQQITLLAVASFTGNGASGVTGAGFITLAATLAVVPGVPVAGLALILGIDRFMSEARALTNFVGNGVATIVVSRWERELDRDVLARELMGRGPQARADAV